MKSWLSFSGPSEHNCGLWSDINRYSWQELAVD